MVTKIKIFLSQSLNKLDNWLKWKKKMRTIRTNSFLKCLIIILLVIVCFKFFFEFQFKSSSDTISPQLKISKHKNIFKATTSITSKIAKKTKENKSQKPIRKHKIKMKTTSAGDEFKNTCVRNFSPNKGKLIHDNLPFIR
jgi:hypothetical protein